MVWLGGEECGMTDGVKIRKQGELVLDVQCVYKYVFGTISDPQGGTISDPKYLMGLYTHISTATPHPSPMNL